MLRYFFCGCASAGATAAAAPSFALANATTKAAAASAGPCHRRTTYKACSTAILEELLAKYVLLQFWSVVVHAVKEKSVATG